MLGRLILVSGISGAGKTTLIHYAVNNVPNLEYLQTTTTRPRRSDEAETIEYEFVTDSEYETLRESSPKWDHTDYKGYKYGADVEHIRYNLLRGMNVVCSVAPDIDVIENMKRLYDVEPVLLWIDTPTLVARQRTADDSARASREEDESVKYYFEHIFAPKGNLDKDRPGFLAMLEDLLK